LVTLVVTLLAFVLLGHVPPVLALALAGMVYLTWLEVRSEPLSPLAKLWWCLLVFLLNIAGYVLMRVAFIVWRQRRA